VADLAKHNWVEDALFDSAVVRHGPMQQPAID
jgi:hypothetical protein